MKKSRALLCILGLLLCLSGCSLAGVDAENIMQPPKATGEQAGIQSALEKAAGSNIVFKYPRTGDYRSAVIMHDVTGDGENEAIAFYRPQGAGEGAHMTVIQKQEGTWNVLCDFSGPGADIDKVAFGDFNGNGIDEIVVGWGLLTTRDKSCSIYQYQNSGQETGVIRELLENNLYTEMAVLDINMDGKAELLSVFSSNQASIANLLGMRESTLETIGLQVRLDPAVTSHLNVQTAKLDSETPAMILDGYVATNSLTTEMLYWDEAQQKLVAPLNDPETGTAKYVRDVSLHPRDINEDGYVDFPVQAELPGEKYLKGNLQESMSLPALITWNSFQKKDASFTPITKTMIGPVDSVWLVLDALGMENLTAIQDISQGKITYYLWNGKKENLSEALFDIQVFPKYEWDQAVDKTKGFVKKEEKAGLVYAIKFYENSMLDEVLKEQIQTAFVVS